MSSVIKRELASGTDAPERPIRRDRWSWDQKVEVATKFMQLGNTRLVSELTEVPYQTIADWRKTDWWSELIDELKQIKRSKTGTKLAEIIEQSIVVVQDRLENGDFVLNNKTGEINRRPVSLRDAAQVTNQLITRQIQMEELAEKLVNRKDSVKETLHMLAKEFAKFNREQNKKEATTIQYVEVIDAIHDEREEGLQEGSSEIYVETGSKEEASTSEQSP
jgi:hypothetical protein